MPWLILSEDAPGAARLRADAVLMAAHWDYELSIKHRILAAGSLRSDDGLIPTGSLLLVGADSRTMRLVHWMLDPDTGRAWGASEAVAITFDLDARKIVPISQAAQGELAGKAISGLRF